MSLGQPSSDINKSSAKFKILVADRIVAREIITSEIQVGETTMVPLTFSTGLQTPVTVTAVFERLTESLMCMTVPEIRGTNDGTGPANVQSDNTVPAELLSSLDPPEMKFTPFFETFPGPITFYNACIVSILSSGHVNFRFQFGPFSPTVGSPIGCAPFTYVYNVNL